MRSLKPFSSLIGAIAAALAQAVPQRHALVEHKAFAAPAAFMLRHAFEVFQDAALEVVDLAKPARQEKTARLLAADAAGAEHRDLPVSRRIELLRGKFLELPEARDAGINRAIKRSHRDLERVAGVDHERIGLGDQRVPLGRLDIDADLPRWIDIGIAERDDLLLQPDL